MRIAYVSLHWPRTRNSGVGKKIQSQVAAWSEMGHQARLFMHTAKYVPQSELIEADYFFYDMAGKLITEINRIIAMTRMILAIRDFHPDVIYLRYGIYVYPVHKLVFLAPVVEEINTDDLKQHNELGRLYSLYNRVTRGFLLRSVNGLVTMTRELAVGPAFAHYNKPTRVIANGIDLNNIRPLPPPQNEVPHLIFIATPGYYWHGVDKLAALARNFSDLIVEVVGYDRIAGWVDLPENLRLLGYLEGVEYYKALARADVAIGTVALHRKGMEEACPLKTRECLAYGIPMVIPYIDSDLNDLDCEFLLKIPNKEDNIFTHGESIRDFAYQMRGQRADHSLLGSIDQRYKESKRLEFFTELITVQI
jgi:glycosyltransferase involved in cell wall biosynthesis